jgi:Phage tail assembly chaperone proteins, E, or 41 or 14
MSDETTLDLVRPVVLGKGEASVTYAEITLREPTAGELEKASREDTPIGTTITLISLVSKLPRVAVERFCQRDLKAANDFLASFSAPGAETETDTDT